MFVNQVLEHALACFVADRTVQRMIDEQSFQRILPDLEKTIRRCDNGHSVCDRRLARSHGRRISIDFNDTHPAGPYGFHPFMKAESWDSYSRAFRSLKDRAVLPGENLPAVNRQFHLVHPCFSFVISRHARLCFYKKSEMRSNRRSGRPRNPAFAKMTHSRLTKNLYRLQLPLLTKRHSTQSTYWGHGRDTQRGRHLDAQRRML